MKHLLKEENLRKETLKKKTLTQKKHSQLVKETFILGY